MTGFFRTYVDIGPYRLGPGFPPLIVAEIGGNHGGDPALAAEMIDAAAQAGVGAVKFQTYHTGSFLTRNSPYYDELAGEELSLADQAVLRRRAESQGLVFLTTVFDRHAVDFARAEGLAAVKISSGDLTNRPLIEAAAGLQKPLIVSTGAAEANEVDEALSWLQEAAAGDVVLLHCTSLYPCPDQAVNLAALPEMSRRYGLPVGFSDHTSGTDIPLAAAALGAAAIEKHFTTDRALPGGDNEMSCLPGEMFALAAGAARISAALGDGIKRPAPAEDKMRSAIRRIAVAGKRISAGDRIEADMVVLKRGRGEVRPADVPRIVGRRAAVDYAPDDPFLWERVI